MKISSKVVVNNIIPRSFTAENRNAIARDPSMGIVSIDDKWRGGGQKLYYRNTVVSHNLIHSITFLSATLYAYALFCCARITREKESTEGHNSFGTTLRLMNKFNVLRTKGGFYYV
jgi:hypothetical protein